MIPARIILNILKQFADHPFIKDGRTNLSYGDFFERVKDYALVLNRNGLKKGDIVIISGGSCLKQIIAFFAIWLNKAITFPLNPKTPYDQTNSFIKLSRAQYIISEKSVFDHINNIHFNELDKKPVGDREYFSMELAINIPATIILTSGSSGNPKCVVHTLNNHFHSARAVNNYFEITNPSKWLLALPVFHVSGMAIIFRSLLSGSVIHTFSSQDLKSLSEYTSFVPTQLWRILKKNKSSIKLLQKFKAILLGGSSIPASLIQQSLEYNLPVFTSYGLTEMASTVAIKKIVDNITDGASVLEPYRVKSLDGEILVKGPSLFLGYYQDRKIQTALDPDDWFHTKDLGKIDENKITIKGRQDNMFISGGENIYPEEIERELLKIKGIRQAIVVSNNNKEFGKRPIAYIEADHINEELIKDFLRKKLSPFKIPDLILPLPEKYNKSSLKEDRAYLKSLH